MVKQQSVSADLVIGLAGALWGETVEFLVEKGVTRDEAETFAGKVRWGIEGLLDHVR